MLVQLGPWLLSCDREQTAAKCAAMTTGAAVSCGCDGCGNYLAVRKDHFPVELSAFLANLGVDPEKEVSVRRVAPLDAGHSLYAGSFAMAGRIMKGPEDDNQSGWKLDVFEEMGPYAHLAARRWDNPPPPWENGKCVRLRFLITLPWRGEDPAAPVDLGGCKGPVDRLEGK